MNRASTIALAAVTIAQLSVILPAQAQTTMTFDSNAGTGPYACGGATEPYIESGFQLTFYNYSEPETGGPHAGWCSDNENYAGSAAMWAGTTGALITLTAVGGGTFTLNSIDLARMFFDRDVVTVRFSGYQLGGGLLSATGNTTGTLGSTPTFSTTVFDATWTNLTAVTWQNNPEFHQFDNIVLNGQNAEVVPEPVTMSLLATGLAGMAGAGFRRRRKKA